MGHELVPVPRRRCREVEPVVRPVVPLDDRGTAVLAEGYRRGLEIGREQRRTHVERSKVAQRTGGYPHWFLVLLMFVLPMLSAAASLSSLAPAAQLVAILGPLLLVLPVTALIAVRSRL